MKEIFFRIIDLPTHQVLLERDFQDDDSAPFVLVVCFFHDGVKVKQSMGYFIEEHRDEVFRDFTDKQAQAMVDGVLEMLTPDPAKVSEGEANDE